jgi:hypothetical protein
MAMRAIWSGVATAVAASVLAIALPVAPADAQWVFVARKVIGKVHHMAESQQTGKPGYDVATVLLDVPADRLYGFALERASHNRSVRIVMQDPAARRFEIAEGHRTATLTVIPITDQVSHLVIAGTAGRNEESTTSQVVGAVMRICKEMGKDCSLG